MATNKAERASNTDGKSFKILETDVVPGSVLRMLNADGTAAPFSDFVVVAKYWVGKDGKRLSAGLENDDFQEVVLARPYLYATGAHTASPSHLTGVEELKVNIESLLKQDSLFRVVCTARGSLHDYVK